MWERLMAWWNAEGVVKPWYNAGDARDFNRIILSEAVLAVILVLGILIAWASGVDLW
jgi:uncharacterized membrane protein